MNKILANKNIVITRSEDQAFESIRKLNELGANVLSIPTIVISPVKNNTSVDETLKNLDSFNSIIFSSENAVKFFLIKLKELNVKFASNKFFIVSVGDKTSKICKHNNIKIDFQPSKFTSEILITELSKQNLNGKKFLIPSSSLSDLEKFNLLKDFGAEVNSIIVYENCINDVKDLTKEIFQLQNINVDMYIFTSPSTFNGFLKILNIENPKQYFKNKKISVIGPVTKKALLDKGIEPDIIPKNYSMEFLIEEIKNFYSTNFE